MSQLQTVTQQVRDAVTQYRFDHASQALYEFVWAEYCDWYLELSKPGLMTDEDSSSVIGTRCQIRPAVDPSAAQHLR